MHTTGRGAASARTAGDLLLGLVLAAMLVFTAAALAASWGGFAWAFGLGAGTAASALALLRRRHRFGTAVAGLVVAVVAVVVARAAALPEEPAPAMALALAVLVASALRSLPVRRAAVVVGGGLVVVVASWLAATPFVPESTVIPMVNGVAWLAAVATGLGGRLLVARREAAVDRVRRDERLAVARELHDVVAHHITGIVVQAQAARIVAGRTGGPAPLATSLAGIEWAGSDALASLRRVVGLLRDAEDASSVAPVPEAIGTLVSRFEDRGPGVRLSLSDDGSGWPPEVTTTVYRVVQEALTNVTRHAPQARSVTVDVGRTPGGISVEVSDDAPHAAPGFRHGIGSGGIGSGGGSGGIGSGGRSATGSGGGSGGIGSGRGSGVGFGLIGMRERVEALGGTLSAGPRPDAGWTVLATLPVPGGEPR